MSNGQGGQLLDAIVTSIVSGSAHSDATIRRTCLQILTRLTGDWCGVVSGNVKILNGQTSGAAANGMDSSSSSSSAQESVPGFRRYAIDVIASEACILALFGGTSSSPSSLLDPKDAATNAVLGESAALLKLVASSSCSGGGGELGSQLLATSLPQTGLPMEIQHQVAICLRDFEAKELKEALKAGLVWKLQQAQSSSSRMS